MNPARTTYQTDYTPYDWLQNNFVSDMNEFCSPENVDECLKYISQEFCALGYPSIYSNPSDCPCAVNCDIVKLLNATYELLRSNNEKIQTKEDLESSNRRLCADLNVLNKRNSQLKNTLEQIERKLACSLEKERQLKEKNEQLSQLLKTEKEETKKLTIQLRQQKVAYQHEIRKSENNMNHIKAKLNQMLSDKTPNKKIASIGISHVLPRNTGQRGKWKVGSAATTAVEDMYNSVISNYETRCKNMYKELGSLRQSLQSVLLQILEIVSVSQNDIDGNNWLMTSNEFVLNEIKSETRDVKAFEEKFKYLLSIWQEIASNKIQEANKNLENEVISLKSKVSHYEMILEKNKQFSHPQVDESQIDICNSTVIINKEEFAKSMAEDFIKKEKMKLDEQKLALSKSLENMEKEKAEISAQKLAILRLAMQQKVGSSSWHQALNTSPSISVITSRNGATRIAAANLKSSFSLPDQIGHTNSLLLSDLESSEETVNKVLCSKSDSRLLSESGSATEFPPLTPNIKFSNSDLPSWAMNNSGVQNFVIDDIQNTSLEARQSISAGEIEIAREPSSEELNFIRLKAAMQDIENRMRTSIS